MSISTATIVLFVLPSCTILHGDQLLLKLTATELGERSFAANITAYANNEERFSADTVLVYVNEAGRPTSWPESHKIKIFSFMRSEND